MEKKTFEVPTVEVISFNSDDVIATSGDCFETSGQYGTPQVCTYTDIDTQGDAPDPGEF